MWLNHYNVTGCRVKPGMTKELCFFKKFSHYKTDTTTARRYRKPPRRLFYAVLKTYSSGFTARNRRRT